MSIFKVIFELFVFYLLYKLVFDFIIPVYTTTKQVKKQFGDMQNNVQEQMKKQQQQEQNQYSAKSTATPPRQPKNDDYIDYEEVK
jgi:bisphosphoglycerate-dependent phosphoglycerate mutase